MRLVQLFFPPDPGALRLLAALRATLAGLLTFFLVMLLGSFATLPVTDRLLGFAMALFIAANVRDATMRQRLVTIALAPVFGFAATALAAVLSDQPLAAAVLLPLVMFAVTYGATRGPRWATVGIVALIGYFIGLVTRAPPATLPMRFVVVALAAADAALIRCLLLPERPRAELARLRRAVHSGLVRVLDLITAAVTAGAWTSGARAALRSGVRRLDDEVMLAQARVAALTAELPDQPNPWLHLLAIQLGVERVARAALSNLGGPSEKGPLLAILTALRRGGDPTTRPDGRLAGALVLLGHAIHAPAPEGTAPAAAPPPPTAAPAWRSAVMTAIATALAIIVGNLVSPNRWYWAAFAAYVMFQGTRSRGETLTKGTQFVIGTLAGVVFGVLLATVLSGHEILTMAAIVVAVFLAFQANVAAYGAMIFWITVILGLMFGMLGYFPPELLLLRLKESAAGAACGAAVAFASLGRRQQAAIEAAMRAFLAALGQSVNTAAQAVFDGRSSPELAALIVTTEQRFRDLAAIAQAERLGVVTAHDEPLRRRMLILEGCERWARELGEIGLSAVRLEEPAMVNLARDALARIDRSIPALLDRLASRSVIEPTDEDAEAPFDLQGTDLPRAVRLLLRIESALLHMSAYTQR